MIRKYKSESKNCGESTEEPGLFIIKRKILMKNLVNKREKRFQASNFQWIRSLFIFQRVRSVEKILFRSLLTGKNMGMKKNSIWTFFRWFLNPYICLLPVLFFSLTIKEMENMYMGIYKTTWNFINVRHKIARLIIDPSFSKYHVHIL